jgi:1-acyl-sn-glycerol-3-phosphate acyltransferase
VSIAYTKLDGMPIGRRLRPLFAWYGSMALAPHLWTVVGLGTVEIVVEFHPPTTLADCGSRKALARYCQDHVARGLATALSGRRGPPRENKAPPEPQAPREPERLATSADTAAPALG